MKQIIIPVSFSYPSHKNSASERIRCDWLLPYLPADKYDGTQNLNDYDVVIYQRAHDKRALKLAEEFKGKKLQILDITDPDFFFPEQKCVDGLMDCVDFVTTSTQPLAIALKQYGITKPIYTIPDGHEFSFYKTRKVHRNVEKPVCVWFGYADNFDRIKPLLHIIRTYGLELITICEKPVCWGKFVKWDLSTVNDEIIKGDVVLNLPDTYGYKSNNKTVAAWLLGMPVVEKIEDFFTFLDYDKRVLEVKHRLDDIEQFDIKRSSKMLVELINNFKKL